MVMQTIDIEPDIVQAMDDMPYGCYIVGSHDCAGIPNGMMADWLMQVAFTPRMVAVSFENDAHTLANICTTGTFTVNMLPRDDSGMHLAARFAQPYDGAKVAGRSHNGDTTIHHKLEGLAFHDASDGSPVLDGACAWLECEADAFVGVGDHTLVTARVVDGRMHRDVDVLTSEFAGWTYSG